MPVANQLPPTIQRTPSRQGWQLSPGQIGVNNPHPLDPDPLVLLSSILNSTAGGSAMVESLSWANDLTRIIFYFVLALPPTHAHL